jgi:hypothetical protein
MESSRPQLLILADAPDALRILFGISLLERLLRVVQRLGFREGVIITDSSDVADHLAAPSWAREELALSFRRKILDAIRVSEIRTGVERTLVVSAGLYYDARLLKTLAEQSATTSLVDSAPPAECALLWENCKLGAAAALLNRADDFNYVGMEQRFAADQSDSHRFEIADFANPRLQVLELRMRLRVIVLGAVGAIEIAFVGQARPNFQAQPPR